MFEWWRGERRMVVVSDSVLADAIWQVCCLEEVDWLAAYRWLEDCPPTILVIRTTFHSICPSAISPLVSRFLKMSSSMFYDRLSSIITNLHARSIIQLTIGWKKALEEWTVDELSTRLSRWLPQRQKNSLEESTHPQSPNWRPFLQSTLPLMLSVYTSGASGTQREITHATSRMLAKALAKEKNSESLHHYRLLASGKRSTIYLTLSYRSNLGCKAS